jgi:hypothetical protein
MGTEVRADPADCISLLTDRGVAEDGRVLAANALGQHEALD